MSQFTDFLEVFDLLKNPEKYESLLHQLIEHEKAIKDNIALSEDVTDINTAKQLAADALNEALAIKEEAKKEAAKIKAGQAAAYDKKFADLAAKQVVADQAIADRKAMEIRLASREAELAERLRQLTKQEDALYATKMANEALNKELQERLEKLRSVMG